MKQSTTINKKFVLSTKPFYKSFIPEDWTIIEFGNVFSFLKTFSFSRKQLTDEKTNNEIQNIHYGDIHSTFDNKILDFKTEKRIPYLKDGFISKELFDDAEFPALQDGDLIIADASEDYEGVCDCIEIKNINERKVISGLHTFAARGNNKNITIGFRTFVLDHQQVIRQLRRIATGISVYGVSKTNLSRVKIALPPLYEQKAIARLLSTWDTAINQNNQLIAQKELLKKWLMQNLLTGKKRLKGFGEEWETRLLKDVLIPISRPVDKPSSSFLALGIRSHGKGTFLKHDFEPSKIAMETLYTVRESDLIVNITFAWEGAIAIVKKHDDGALVSHRFPTYNFNHETGIVDYFRHLILQPKLRYLLDLISPGGAGRNRVLNKKDFLKLEVKIPAPEEQTAIAQVLQAADKEIQLLNTKTDKLSEQKRGMMQQLLTGKKRLII
ncbi:MAG: restriction endonuclease subunit S [Bacteroidetes bacterium]|nr:restriction endonuclease subunit S [Bacteroidota bacterium]